MTDDTQHNHALIERIRKERRRFNRVRLSIPGRLYIPATQEEAICMVEDISPGDVSIVCELKQEPQGNIVIYLDGLGRFEGSIARRTQKGFAVSFVASQQKRERLADQLTLHLNRQLVGESQLRNYERAPAAAGSHTVFTRASGEQVRCVVLDFSLTGISVKSDVKPPIGEHILIGHRAGRVARHHAEGVGIEFLGLSFPNTSLFERVSATTQSQQTSPAPPLSLAAGGR